MNSQKANSKNRREDHDTSAKANHDSSKSTQHKTAEHKKNVHPIDPKNKPDKFTKKKHTEDKLETMK